MAQERTIGFKINIKGSEDLIKTIAQLKEAIKETTKELENTERGSKEYEALNKRLTETKTALKEVRTEQQNQIRQFEGVKAGTGSYKQLNAELVKLRQDFKNLSAEAREGIAGKDLVTRIQALDSELKDLDKTIGNNQRNVGNYSSAFEGLDSIVKGDISSLSTLAFGSGGVAVLAGLFVEGAQAVADLTLEFTTLRGEIEQLTGLTGSELDEFTVRVRAISETFGVGTDEVTASANALTKQLTGDFSESLRVLEEGFVAGANASGELLDSTKEYSVFLKEAGLSADDFLRIINQTAKEGLFSDKGIDAVKEAVLSLRELPKPAEDALNAIGLTSEQIAEVIGEKGVGGAIALVSKQLGNFEDDSREVGQVLADIFKGAGEDVGVSFVKSLSELGEEFTELEGASTEYAKRQREILDLNQELAESQNELTKQFQNSDIEFKRTSTTIKTTAIDALTQWVKNIKTATGFIGSLVSRVRDLSESSSVFGTVLNVIGRALNALLTPLRVGLAVFTVDYKAAFEGFSAGASQAVENVKAVFNGLALTARITALQIQRSLSLKDAVRSSLDEQIEQLKSQRAEFAEQGRSIGEAYSEAYQRSIEESKKALDDLASATTANTKRITQATSTGTKIRADKAKELTKQQEKELEKRRKLEAKFQKDVQALEDEASQKLAVQIKADTERLKTELDLRVEAERNFRSEMIKAAQESFDKEDDQLEDRAKKRLERIKSSFDVELSFLNTARDKLLQDETLTQSQRQAIRTATNKEITELEIDRLEETLNIAELSVSEQIRLEEELAKRKSELIEQEQDERKTAFLQGLDFTVSALNQLQSISANADRAILNNQIQNLEEQTALQIANAQGNATEIERIEQESAQKRDDLEKQFKKKEQDRAVISAIINGAQAVTKTFAELGFTPVGFLAAALSAGVTASQVALIRSQKFAQGGLLSGPSHASGGIKAGGVEFEGGEAVINKRSTRMFRNELSAINEAGGGRRFADGGVFGSLSLPSSSQSSQNFSAVINEMRQETQAVAELAMSIRQSVITQRVILDTDELDSVQNTKIQIDNIKTLR